MTWAELLWMLKDATDTTNFDNIEDSVYYRALSKSHKEIAEFIKAKLDSKYFMWIAQCDLVLGQNIYDRLWFSASNWRSITVIDSLYIKYDGVHFKKWVPRDLSELEESREYYMENQSERAPFYVITWNKVMLFPTPKNDVENGIEIIWSRNVWDIDATSTDATIFNGVTDIDYNLIVKWAEEMIFKHIWQYDKAKASRNEFLYEDLERMRWILSYRGSQPVAYEEPNWASMLR